MASPHAHVRALFIGSEREPRISSFPSVAAILRLVMEDFGLAAIPPLFVRPELERALVQYEGPTLPPLTITVTHGRAVAPAVQAVAMSTRDVVAAYCRTVGTPWATSLLPAEAAAPGRRTKPSQVKRTRTHARRSWRRDRFP